MGQSFIDPLAQQLTVGGAFAVVILFVVFRYGPWAKGTANGPSGDKPVAFWVELIRKTFKEVLEDFSQGRNEEIRRIIREELRMKQ